MKRFLLGIWLLLATFGFAMADPFEDGSNAFRNGDFSEAVKLWRQPAEQGYAAAQHALGYAYGRGEGVPQDPVLAYMWFNLSAAHGYANAANDRNTVAKYMTLDQIAEAQRLAREWTPKQ